MRQRDATLFHEIIGYFSTHLECLHVFRRSTLLDFSRTNCFLLMNQLCIKGELALVDVAFISKLAAARGNRKLCGRAGVCWGGWTGARVTYDLIAAVIFSSSLADWLAGSMQPCLSHENWYRTDYDKLENFYPRPGPSRAISQSCSTQTRFAGRLS